MLTGAGGQLGYELCRARPATVELAAMDRASLDICDREKVVRHIQQFRPDVVINAAAYTQVDRAETEIELAFRTNAAAPKVLAEAAAEIGARIVHVSTDFVFSGGRGRPWLPTDPAEPVSAYGRSKLAGERAVVDILGNRSTVVRTAWLYSSHGNNFVNTMLGLMRSRDRLGVVVDQVGTPTWAAGLAETLWAFAARDDLSGVFHWTDEGVASWYDFAVAIQNEALQRGLLERRIHVDAVATSEYPTAARRPAYSVLDKRSTTAALGRIPNHWRRNLGKMLDELSTA